MRKEIHVCDRCRSEIPTESGMHLSVNHSESTYDLCQSCSKALTKWLGRDNTTRPGFPPVGYIEKCLHHIPCAGPCNNSALVKV